MNSYSWKLNLIVVAVLSSGCATTTKDFNQVNPDSIAVVIGYKITAKESVHPALRNSLAFAVQMLLPVTSLVTAGGNVLAGVATQAGVSVIGKENTVTVEEAINDIVYQRVECSLSMKGYKPSLKYITPVEFSEWENLDLEEKYDEHISSHYSLDQDRLASFNSDAILYIEYAISVYASDIDEKQPLMLTDLQIDSGFARIYAVSTPPDNLILFGKGGYHSPYFSRANIYETVDSMIRFHDWPARGKVHADDVNESCKVNSQG